MASIKIILRSKANKEGLYPLALQIIKDRRSSIQYVGHSIKKTDWDAKGQKVKKSHPNSTRMNNILAKKVVEAQEKLLELEAAKTDTSARAIRQSFDAAKQAAFATQAQIYLDTLEKQGKFNRLSADKPRIERFKEFMGADVLFSEITVPVLKKFSAWLKGTREVSDRTVVNHLVVMRSIYNQAITAMVVDPKHYPFGKKGIKIKFPDTSKVGLTAEEIQALERVELPPLQDHARNLFLFSFYLAGVRISDVLRMRWSDFQDGRLSYVMGKNNKGGSLKVPEKALRIVSLYPVHRHDLVFPDLQTLDTMDKPLEVQRRIKSVIHDLNERLRDAAKAAGIRKPVTFHISRHSFAQQASDKIPIQILQKLYRHSSLLTTAGYQSNFTHKDVDTALDSVLDF